MTCEGCALTVKNALTSVPGVVDAEVSYKEGKAVVKLSGSQTDEKQLANAVEKAGYKIVSENKKTN